MRYAVLMAGGTGTRLWPLSRSGHPKQLLAVGDGRSLLRVAFDRLAGVVPPERVFVACGRSHQDAVREELVELPAGNVLGEPVARDTASAIGFAAAVIGTQDPDARIAFVTTDHVIEPVPVFADALRTGFEVIDERPSALVTFGIVPTAPETGYGYIERGPALRPDGSVHAVSAFAEKPDLETARCYLDSGRYLWNAGTFVWRADTVLEALGTQLPDTAAGLRRIAAAWSGPARQDVLDEVYADLRKISIDYALLEPVAQHDAGRLVVVPMELDWLDIGSWPALGTTLPTDADGNATDGLTVLVDSADNVVVSDDPEHLVATVGLREMIVVRTQDATLVCPKTAAGRVKDLVERIRECHGNRFV